MSDKRQLIHTKKVHSDGHGVRNEGTTNKPGSTSSFQSSSARQRSSSRSESPEIVYFSTTSNSYSVPAQSTAVMNNRESTSIRPPQRASGAFDKYNRLPYGTASEISSRQARQNTSHARRYSSSPEYPTEGPRIVPERSRLPRGMTSGLPWPQCLEYPASKPTPSDLQRRVNSAAETSPQQMLSGVRRDSRSPKYPERGTTVPINSTSESRIRLPPGMTSGLPFPLCFENSSSRPITAVERNVQPHQGSSALSTSSRLPPHMFGRTSASPDYSTSRPRTIKEEHEQPRHGCSASNKSSRLPPHRWNQPAPNSASGQRITVDKHVVPQQASSSPTTSAALSRQTPAVRAKSPDSPEPYIRSCMRPKVDYNRNDYDSDHSPTPERSARREPRRQWVRHVSSGSECSEDSRDNSPEAGQDSHTSSNEGEGPSTSQNDDQLESEGETTEMEEDDEYQTIFPYSPQPPLLPWEVGATSREGLQQHHLNEAKRRLPAVSKLLKEIKDGNLQHFTSCQKDLENAFYDVAGAIKSYRKRKRHIEKKEEESYQHLNLLEITAIIKVRAAEEEKELHAEENESLKKKLKDAVNERRKITKAYNQLKKSIGSTASTNSADQSSAVGVPQAPVNKRGLSKATQKATRGSRIPRVSAPKLPAKKRVLKKAGRKAVSQSPESGATANTSQRKTK